MKILLVGMSGVRVTTPELRELGVSLPGFIERGKVIASLPHLGLLILGAQIPPHFEVEYLEIDSYDSQIPLIECDLVAISALSARIYDAYNLADRYRDKGTHVVMGGLHVSALPEEALLHCDSIIKGSAENVWTELLKDFENGIAKKIYQGEARFDFRKYPHVMPRFSLLKGREYNRLTIQTSRGCPRDCEFCASTPTITKGFHTKPVDWVIAEIREAKKFIDSNYFEFADDNTFLDKNWGKDLLKALATENIKFFTETDASVADDLELCDLLKDAGCRQLLIGFESPFSSDLIDMDPVQWKAKSSAKIHKVIDTLQSRGISVNGCFVLGLDNHGPEIFSLLNNFVKSSGLAEVQYTVLTPFPGTQLYMRLKMEGRLLKNEYWNRCTLFDVNFVPKKMSVQELEDGMIFLFKNTYTREATSLRKRSFSKQMKKFKQVI